MTKLPDIVVVDETLTYSLHELCVSCGVYAERVVELVEYGIVEPIGDDPRDWRFDAQAVFRTRRALNLCNDLDLNLAGVSLALELLDQVDALREEVQRLTRLLP